VEKRDCGVLEIVVGGHAAQGGGLDAKPVGSDLEAACGGGVRVRVITRGAASSLRG